MAESQSGTNQTPEVPSPYLTTAYTELSRSYLALHDFRMKLLGLLPAASVAGLLALGKSLTALPPTDLEKHIVGYIGLFSSVFTLALFGYEVRSLLMCHDYWLTGADLETKMGIMGQFTWCNETRPFPCYQGGVRHRLARMINDKLTSSLVYSFVFASWFFAGLKFTLNWGTNECAWWALGIGAAVAVSALLFLRNVTSHPQTKGNTSSYGV